MTASKTRRMATVLMLASALVLTACSGTSPANGTPIPAATLARTPTPTPTYTTETLNVTLAISFKNVAKYYVYINKTSTLNKSTGALSVEDTFTVVPIKVNYDYNQVTGHELFALAPNHTLVILFDPNVVVVTPPGTMNTWCIAECSKLTPQTNPKLPDGSLDLRLGLLAIPDLQQPCPQLRTPGPTLFIGIDDRVSSSNGITLVCGRAIGMQLL